MNKISKENLKNHKKGLSIIGAILIALLLVLGVKSCSTNPTETSQTEEAQELSFSFLCHDEDSFDNSYCDHEHEFIKLSKNPHYEIITHSNQDLEYIKIFKLDENNKIDKKIGSRLDIEANKRIVIKCNLNKNYPNLLIEFKVKDGKTYKYIPLHNSNCDSYDFEYVDESLNK